MAKRRSLASRLNQKIEILEITIVPDGEGGWSESESVYATTYALVEPASESKSRMLVAESVVADSVQSRLSYFIAIRPMRGLSHTMKIKWTNVRADHDETEHVCAIRAITTFPDRIVIGAEEQAE